MLKKTPAFRPGFLAFVKTPGTNKTHSFVQFYALLQALVIDEVVAVPSDAKSRAMFEGP